MSQTRTVAVKSGSNEPGNAIGPASVVGEDAEKRSARSGIRTLDLGIKSPLLYQLS